MAGFPLFLRQRLIGHPAQEVLEEPVMAPLGRLRVSLDSQNLLSDERGKSC